MGGSGSGARSSRMMTTNEAFFSISIKSVQLMLDEGQKADGTIEWSGGVIPFSFSPSPAILYLGPFKRPTATLPLAPTPQPFGGLRWWFQCTRCWRYRRVLYQPQPEYPFRCRVCYGLRYGSQREDDGQRMHRKAAKYCFRAGLDWPDAWDAALQAFPPKPRRMHWKTYARLEEGWYQADRRRDDWFAEEFVRKFPTLIGEVGPWRAMEPGRRS